jgi:AraC-like DNA-binding protein
MPACGTTNFNDAGDYQANIRGAKFNLTFRCQRNFRARLTWMELGHLHLLFGQENLPRVAHISLHSSLAYIELPVSHEPPLVCNGVELQRGDIVFHGLGDGAHQRMRGPGQWSLISLTPAHLAALSRTLTGYDLAPPPVARILRPTCRDAEHLLHLYAEARHLAETKPEIIAHQEVARAIEHDLLYALINCLISSDPLKSSASNQRQGDIIARFEDVIAAHPERHLPTPELCAIIGVPERTMRMCCAEFLGMSPSQYLRLHRLNLARAELRRIVSPATSVEEVARRHGFPELGRFAAIYRTVFGERPSTTLRYARAAK